MRVEIPTVNWSAALAEAIRQAIDSTVIVVNSEAKKELALRAAERLGKTISVEVK